MFNEVRVTCSEHSKQPSDCVTMTGLRGEPKQSLEILLKKSIAYFRQKYSCDHRLNVYIKTDNGANVSVY